MEFYTNAAGESEGEYRAVFEELARAKTKRKQVVERTRRENVAEMILEAVRGLDGDNYRMAGDSGTEKGARDFVRQGIENEEKTERFYDDASERIGIGEVARVFQKLARESTSHKAKLKSLSP
ncbi:MAG: hypothetical protein M1358_12755 [Chloroflexi bacterium]|nr:hypothetical protein [Chloroflexota bacterium]